MGDLITKVGKKKESTAPQLRISGAEVKILSAKFLGIGDVVTKNDGSTFTVDKPRIDTNCEVIDTPKHKKGDIGTQWFESFYYPETEKGSGEYENRPNTKIGNLTTLIYGEGWDEKGTVLKPEDMEGLTFLCNLKVKTEFGGTKPTGTMIEHDSFEAIPQEEDWADIPMGDPPPPDFSKTKGKK